MSIVNFGLTVIKLALSVVVQVFVPCISERTSQLDHIIDNLIQLVRVFVPKRTLTAKTVTTNVYAWVCVVELRDIKGFFGHKANAIDVPRPYVCRANHPRNPAEVGRVIHDRRYCKGIGREVFHPIAVVLAGRITHERDGIPHLYTMLVRPKAEQRNLAFARRQRALHVYGHVNTFGKALELEDIAFLSLSILTKVL